MLDTSSTLAEGSKYTQTSLTTCIKPRDEVHLHVKNITIRPAAHELPGIRGPGQEKSGSLHLCPASRRVSKISPRPSRPLCF